MNPMRKYTCKFIILALSLFSFSSAGANDPHWIEDYPNPDYPDRLYSSVVFSGIFTDKTKHPFEINIRCHIDSIKNIEHQVFDSIEITIDGKKMTAPQKALKALLDYNAGSGRFDYIESQSLFYITFQEIPAGEDQAALIFKDGKFWKRQIKELNLGPIPAGENPASSFKIIEYP